MSRFFSLEYLHMRKLLCKDHTAVLKCGETNDTNVCLAAKSV